MTGTPWTLLNAGGSRARLPQCPAKVRPHSGMPAPSRSAGFAADTRRFATLPERRSFLRGLAGRLETASCTKSGVIRSIAQVWLQRVITDPEDSARLAFVALTAVNHNSCVTTTPCSKGFVPV